MATGLPDGREAGYRLLGLQAIPQFGGVVVRRGLTRIFIEGERAAELLDILVERSARGRSLELERLRTDLPEVDREPLESLVEALKASRLLVPASVEGGESREDILFWNFGTSAAAVGRNIGDIRLVIYGINSISLALLGNLRGCGFRGPVLVDHPTLRNPDYFDHRGKLRSEIAGALPNAPRNLEDYEATERQPPDCYIACSDFGGLALMREWNRVAVEKNTLFYPIVLQDHVSYLGPLVAPGDGPCFECFWLRQNANLGPRLRDRMWETAAPKGHHVSGFLQPMARGAADLAAIDLLKFFGREGLDGVVGRLVEADFLAPAIVSRAILKLPRCPVCAEVVQAPPAPVADIEPAPKPEPVVLDPADLGGPIIDIGGAK